MPKQVDPQQRRQLIAQALLELAARRGLQAVSLRQVAAEAGVTAGMVQHYFSNKEEMMRFAMREASARYEMRMNRAFGELGEAPTPREVVGTLLTALLPLNESEHDDARVALAFQAYAATHDGAEEELTKGDEDMRSFVAEQIRTAQTSRIAEVPTPHDETVTAHFPDPVLAATALLGAAEGLAMHILSSKLSPDLARAALGAQLDALFDPNGSAIRTDDRVRR